jgi:small-conductance mechanosensitive channel
MFLVPLGLSAWILPLVLVTSGLLVGFVIENLFLLKLRQLAKKTPWRSDEIILGAFQTIDILALGLLGAYWAIRALPFTAEAAADIRKGLWVAVVVLATWLASRLAVGFLDLALSVGRGPIPQSSIFRNLLKIGIFALGALFVLQVLDQPIGPVLTALGVGGLALAFGLQETLANLFSGLSIIASKKIQPGDFIELDEGKQGFVTDITWRYTALKGLASNEIIVPNSHLAKAVVTNYSLPTPEKSVVVHLGVGYDSDLERVETIIIDEAKRTLREVEGANPDVEPTLRYQSFGDYNIQLAVFLRAKRYTDQFRLKHEFIKRLHRRLGKEKVSHPYPTTVTVNRRRS